MWLHKWFSLPSPMIDQRRTFRASFSVYSSATVQPASHQTESGQVISQTYPNQKKKKTRQTNMMKYVILFVGPIRWLSLCG